MILPQIKLSPNKNETLKGLSANFVRRKTNRLRLLLPKDKFMPYLASNLLLSRGCYLKWTSVLFSLLRALLQSQKSLSNPMTRSLMYELATDSLNLVTRLVAITYAPFDLNWCLQMARREKMLFRDFMARFSEFQWRVRYKLWNRPFAPLRSNWGND